MNTHTDYHLGIIVNATPEQGVIKDYDCGRKFGFDTPDVAGWKPNGSPDDLFDYSPDGFHIGVSVRFRIRGERAVDIQPENGHSEPLTTTLVKYAVRHMHR